jgi:pyrroline-5-carboxylate reductase
MSYFGNASKILGESEAAIEKNRTVPLNNRTVPLNKHYTAAGIKIFEEKGFKDIVYDSLYSAIKRAEELGSISDKFQQSS